MNAVGIAIFLAGVLIGVICGMLMFRLMILPNLVWQAIDDYEKNRDDILDTQVEITDAGREYLASLEK